MIVIFIAIQFIPSGMPGTQPETDKSITHSTLASEAVLNMLKISCFDCHSNQTNFPWYSKLAPSSWLLADHVKEGKSHLNFSDWENYSRREKIGLLEEMKEEVESGAMPLKSYLIIHRDAVLNKEEIKIISDWVTESTEKLINPAGSN